MPEIDDHSSVLSSDLSTDLSTLDSNAGTSTTQRVYEQLRTHIIQGDIAPCERLKVESLKAMLHTGASPIREALSLLTSDQLVERIDQRGFRAAPASDTQFREILMLRCQLEDIALRASIEAGDDSWEEQIVLIHHRLSKAPRDDQQRWEVLHKLFHRTLLAACGSPILLRFCDQLYDLNIRYRFLAGKSGRYAQRDVASEHAGIVQAVLARDAQDACSRLNEHYSLTGEFLSDNLHT